MTSNGEVVGQLHIRRSVPAALPSKGSFLNVSQVLVARTPCNRLDGM